MDMSFSPSGSPSNTRLWFGAVSQRLRSSYFKKPPETLRRVIADCLKSSSSSHHGNRSTVASEAAKTLRLLLAGLISFYHAQEKIARPA